MKADSEQVKLAVELMRRTNRCGETMEIVETIFVCTKTSKHRDAHSYEEVAVTIPFAKWRPSDHA